MVDPDIVTLYGEAVMKNSIAIFSSIKNSPNSSYYTFCHLIYIDH